MTLDCVETEDLLRRMANPFLNDRVERVTRDPLRKLGYDDRFFGTMRLALAAGVQPTNLALGAAAAVLAAVARRDALPDPPASLPARAAALTPPRLAALLREIWPAESTPQADELIALTWHALETLPN